MDAPAVSHSADDPSMSVKRNVTIPDGSPTTCPSLAQSVKDTADARTGVAPVFAPGDDP